MVSKKYPYALKSWENNWSELEHFLNLAQRLEENVYNKCN